MPLRLGNSMCIKLEHHYAIANCSFWFYFKTIDGPNEGCMVLCFPLAVAHYILTKNWRGRKKQCFVSVLYTLIHKYWKLSVVFDVVRLTETSDFYACVFPFCFFLLSFVFSLWFHMQNQSLFQILLLHKGYWEQTTFAYLFLESFLSFRWIKDSM